MLAVPLLALGMLGVLFGAAASAQDGEELEPIVVIEVGDPIDQRLIDYIVANLESEPAHAFILKINSPGASSGDVAELFQAVVDAPAPVIAWIGPFPAVAYGGAAFLANHADVRSAAPGAGVGYLDPTVQRGAAAPPSVVPGADPDLFAATVESLQSSNVEVAEGTEIYGFVDRVDPALGQLIVSIDGIVITRGEEAFELDTATVEVVDEEEVVVQARPVKFVKTGLLDRFLRLGSRPETAFLFLLFGLAFAVFEFYAAGSGLMAFVASLSFILGGYGLATLPIWWPAVAIMVIGVAILVWGFVLNRTDWRAVLGTILLLVSGFTFTTTRPAYPPVAWMVVLAVAGSVLFIWYSMTAVVRGRFATPTVGREELLGKRCLVVDTLDPVGVVVVEGARWQAMADRGVEILAGAPGEIVGITGLLLEIDPVSLPQEPPRPEKTD